MCTCQREDKNFRLSLLLLALPKKKVKKKREKPSKIAFSNLCENLTSLPTSTLAFEGKGGWGMTASEHLPHGGHSECLGRRQSRMEREVEESISSLGYTDKGITVGLKHNGPCESQLPKLQELPVQ